MMAIALDKIDMKFDEFGCGQKVKECERDYFRDEHDKYWTCRHHKLAVDNAKKRMLMAIKGEA